ncbi:MAG: hypothetical protein WBB55_06275 [Anaerolineales bacterium]
MTALLVSTVRRHTSATDPSGYLYVVDLDRKRAVQRSRIIEPPYHEFDTNLRGGMRGCKGIAIREDQVVISNYSVIFRYDPEWNLLGTFTHPSCAGVHDIMFQGETLWVTSARTDILMQFSLSGELLQHYYLREPSLALEELRWKPALLLQPDQIREGSINFLDPRTYDFGEYDRAHVNSLCILPDGDLLVSLGLIVGTDFETLLRMKDRLIELGIWSQLMVVNRRIRSALGIKKDKHTDLIALPIRGKSAITRIAREGSISLCLEIPKATVPGHSLLLLPNNTVVYLNTTEGTVINFDPETCQVLSTTRVGEGFLRGVTSLNNQTLLLGDKQDLIMYDIRVNQVVERIRITADSKEAVYDIKVLPPHYDLPPNSFEEHFEALMGFSANSFIESGQVTRI